MIMSATMAEHTDIQVQALKFSVYQNKRTVYMVRSIFVKKVELTDALYNIALTKIKQA